MAKKLQGSTRRFGARYGIKVRNNIEKIESQQKAKQKCPICLKVGGTVRLATGIFVCKKCNNKFTSKAYFIGKAITTKTTKNKVVIDLDEIVEVKEKEEVSKYKEAVIETDSYQQPTLEEEA